MDIGDIKHLPETYFRRVEFTTQLGCSVGCFFCPQKVLMEALRAKERLLKRETVALVLRNLQASPLKEVHFSGFSEPFLNSECADFIVMAHQAGFQVAIFSTLKGFTSAALEKIKDIPIKLFHISLQPPGSNAHAGLDDDYVWEHIDMILSIKNRFQLRFGCVDTGYSKKEKIELEHCCRKRGFNVIYGQMLDRAGNLSRGKSNHHSKCSRLLCTRNIGFVILPDGECCWCSMDYAARHRVGNLRDMTYNQILCSPAVQSMLRSMAGSGEINNLLCLQCESARPVNLRGGYRELLKERLFGATRVGCSKGDK